MKQTLKRMVSVTLALVLLCSLLPVSALAAATSGKCGDNAYWEFDAATKTLTISGTGEVDEYTFSGLTPWLKSDIHLQIEKVMIEFGITYTGSSTFSECRNLTDAKIAESVKEIGSCTFFNCINLRTVSIPVSLTNIYSYAFMGCTNLEDVYYAGTKEQWNSIIGIDEVMEDFEKRGTVVHFAQEPEAKPSGQCGDNAYWEYDEATKTLTISGTGELDYDIASVSALYSDLDWETMLYEMIDNVIIEEGITKIGHGFFWGGDFKNMQLPNSLLEIGIMAFNFCTIRNGLVLPPNLKVIGNSAFFSAGLKTIEIPASVISIGVHAFMGDTGPDGGHFEEIILHEGLQTIGEQAFCQSYIKTIDLPDSVTSIGSGAFFSAYYLESIEIPKNVTVIEGSTFLGCDCLHSITIHDGVTKIGDGAFAYCESLSEVYFTGSKAQWNAIEIGEDNEALFEAHITYGEESEEDSDNGFRDVKESDWFYNSVMWAVENGITGGIGPNTFGPNDSCTRAQVVTFLWAAAGKPQPTSTSNPFKDVKRSDWFYNAVLWAVENEITSGIRPGEFGPNETCTRAQVVTFLYAAEGKPYVVALDGAFKDVGYKDWFKEEVQWAVNYGVTGGIGNGMFGPNNTCTRGQVVTFLYKADQVDPNGYEPSPLKAYIPAVEDALKTLPHPSYFNGSGFLCDIDKDGVEELVLFWLNDSLNEDGFDAWGHVYSVYDIENGKLVTKIDKEVLCYDAGGPSGSVAVADYAGQRVFMICDSNSSYIEGKFASYEYYSLYDTESFREIVSITIYRDFNTNKVLKCDKNGVVCTYDAFKKVYDAIKFIVEAEIYNNSDSDGSKSLYGMLSYLQSDAGIKATQPAKITQAQADKTAYKEWSDDLNSNIDTLQYKYTAGGSIIHNGVEYYVFALYEKFRDYDWSVNKHLLIDSVSGKIADDLY